jgi:hypothetical protein
MDQNGQNAGGVSQQLDAMVCELIAEFLDNLAAGTDPGVVACIEDADLHHCQVAFTEDGEEACLEGAAQYISQHAMGIKDEGIGRIERYAIAYFGCVDFDDGYNDALLVSFYERPNDTGYSAYVLVDGVGKGDGFMWSDPEPAGEETPLI